MSQEKNSQLMHTLQNNRRKCFSKWVEQIVDDFCEEQAIDERASLDNIKDHFHDDFHERFLYTVPTLLFKFLIDKGIAHIVEPRPPLVKRRSDNNKKWLSRWEKIIENQEWKMFID